MSVTAVLDQPDWKVTITVTDLPVLPTPPTDPWPATPWTLYRTDGLTELPVRGGSEVDLTDSSATVLRDREYPISRPFAYILRYVDAVTGPVAVTSDWIVPDARENPRISDPVTGEGVDVTILSWPDFAHEARATSFDVDGRSEPYVVSGLMGSPTSTLSLRTLLAADWRALRALLTRGNVVLVRATVPSLDDGYVLPSQYVLSRITNHADDTRRLHVLAVRETGQPAPDRVGTGTTLQDLADAYPGGTLADIAADYAFLFEIAAAEL